MPFPSASRLATFLRAYEPRGGFHARVWAVDAEGTPRAPSPEAALFGAPPKLVLLAGGDDGFAVVRQTHDGLQDLDGLLVPWTAVKRLERDPHLVRDLVRVEIAGRAPLCVSVSNHVLLPHNRAQAKALCDLLRPTAPATPARGAEIVDIAGLSAHPA